MQHEQKDAMPWRQARHTNSKREAQGGVAEQRRASYIDDKNVNQVRRLTRRASLQKQGAHGHGRGAGPLQGAEYTHTLRHHADSRFRSQLSLRGTNRTVKVPIIASRTISVLGRHTEKRE